MKIEVQCKRCSISFKKRSADINRSPNHFCSRSCSIAYHNSISPKRIKLTKCAICATNIASNRKYCIDCKSSTRCRNKTIGEYRSGLAVIGKHRSWLHTQIRQFARTWNKDLKMICQVCGYSKHVELAHIKAIKDFSDDTKLEIVNSPNNLLVLCPNHHWEFDYGNLSLQQILHTSFQS